MPLMDELRDLIARHCGGERCQTPIANVRLMKSERPTRPTSSLSEPLFCVVAQGAKRMMLGERIFEYNSAQYLIASVDLATFGEIVEASPATPYLAFSLRLDPAAIAAMLFDLPEAAGARRPIAGVAVSPLTGELVDPAVRLLRLLDRPRDIPMLAPLAERELLYRLLLGEQSAMLRQIALADSRLSQVARAIGWLRGNFEQPLRIEALAAVAGMSPSSFHRHFKAVTAMSPLQFQKRLRLQEARRRMLAEPAGTASVGFAVGYESPSQFSREYSRLFGAPPTRDAARLRASAGEFQAH